MNCKTHKKGVFTMSFQEKPKKEEIVYVDLVPSKISNFIQLVVPKCPRCGSKHNHGLGEGYRSSHCFIKGTGRSVSISYYLKIDWSIPEHAALKERYERLIKEYEK